MADTTLEGPQGVDFRGLHYHGGRIYTETGLVIDEQTLEVVFDFQVQGPMTIDGEASQAYYLTGPISGWDEFLIKVFDLETGALEGELTLNFRISSTTLAKAGDDALAFIHDGIQIIRSPLLTGDGP